MEYRITDIHMAGNEHGQLKGDVIYAKLRDENGTVVTSATLEYVLGVILDQSLFVDGADVEVKMERGVPCSTVHLNKYS